MTRRALAGCLIGAGLGVATLGFVDPSLIGRGARPYAYISVMAVGAMLVIGGALLWKDS